jgi:hypothetical protein
MSVLVTGFGISYGIFDRSRAGLFDDAKGFTWLQDVGCLDAPDVFPAGSQVAYGDHSLVSGSAFAHREGNAR